MRILIDADGCPVVDLTIKIAKQYVVECFILCDTSHQFHKKGATTMIFSKGADSVDFALVNFMKENDIVITQDYGLAAMCLAKKGIVLNQDGMRYTDYNIGSLLEQRYIAKKIRNSGGRLKGQNKRTTSQDSSFIDGLNKILSAETQNT